MSNRGYWRDRPQWRQQQDQQDRYGFGQRTHWRDPFQYRPEEGRTARSNFPRDQYGHEHSSEQLFDRRPFGPDEENHYYGTGAPGYGGPGFTGGAYGYGDGSRLQRQDLEGEYSDESTVSYEGREPGRYQERQPSNYGDRWSPNYQGSSGSSYQGQGRHPAAFAGQAKSYTQPEPSRRFPPGPKGYQRSDARIQEDISDRLYQAYHIDSSEVSVTVSGGRVTLEGMVPSRHMKHSIEDLVDQTSGVTDIENRVRVQGTNYQGSAPTTASASTTPKVTKQ
jgi:osmotically-inducible protein OsmY